MRESTLGNFRITWDGEKESFRTYYLGKELPGNVPCSVKDCENSIRLNTDNFHVCPNGWPICYDCSRKADKWCPCFVVGSDNVENHSFFPVYNVKLKKQQEED